MCLNGYFPLILSNFIYLCFLPFSWLSNIVFVFYFFQKNILICQLDPVFILYTSNLFLLMYFLSTSFSCISFWLLWMSYFDILFLVYLILLFSWYKNLRTVVGRTTPPPPKDVCHISQNLSICYLILQNGLRLLVSWPWDGEIIPNYLSGPHVIMGWIPAAQLWADFCQHSSEARTGGDMGAAGNTPALRPIGEGTEVVQPICKTIGRYQPWTFKIPQPLIHPFC